MITIDSLDFHIDARGWLMVGVEDGAYWYATLCQPGIIKGWHRHHKHTDRLACVSGTARIVAARIVSGEPDMGPGSLVTSYYDIKEVICGPLAPKVVTIPPGVWHAFTPVGNESCLIVNAPDMAYDPDDEERKALADIIYDWVDVSR